MAQLEQPCMVPEYDLSFLQAIFTFVGLSGRAALINSPTASEIFEWQGLITRFPIEESNPDSLNTSYRGSVALIRNGQALLDHCLEAAREEHASR